jgi:hypothetical protein
MNHKHFLECRKDLLNEALHVYEQKGQDYTRSNEDVLHNFKTCANRIGMTPQKALLVYMTKHSDAIENYIKTDGQSESEPIKMRIIDNINYLLFLWALIIEDETTLGEK